MLFCRIRLCEKFWQMYESQEKVRLLEGVVSSGALLLKTVDIINKMKGDRKHT